VEFAKTIKELRLEKNWTQRELAEKINLTDRAVGLWETHGREPNLTTICKLAEIFNITVGQLLGVEEY